MRHTVDFVEDPDGVIVHAFGRADVEGYRALNDLLIDARFRPGMQILVDNTHLDVAELTVSEIDEIGSYVLTLADRDVPRAVHGPIAIVAPNALNRLAAQAISARTGAEYRNLQFFASLAEGLRWLARQEREPVPMVPNDDFNYRIEFLEDPPLVAVTMSGDAIVSGWVRLHEGLRADPRVKGLPLLIDHCGLDGTFLTSEDIRVIEGMVTDMDEELQTPRRAVVVSGDFEFGLARMCHQRLDADVEQRVGAFRSREAALAWLTA
jgi:hypothetical protein